MMRGWAVPGFAPGACVAMCAVALVAVWGAPYAGAQTPVRPTGTRSSVRADACLPSDSTCVPPRLSREFRGVWVATVGNMDWPSRAGLPTDSAKQELTHILDAAEAIGLNAVFFQVRPAGDALYASKLEPWSEYLTGRQGRAPDVAWDPLAFAVKEAHARGLELHAWFNPYRAKDPSGKGPAAATHFSRQYPAYAKRYGTYTWFDPGEPLVLRHAVRVILDVLQRYDVDGIHLDDYFYPYPVQRRRRDVPFPDATSWAKYQRAGGKLSRDDWRRENVNRLVDTLHREIAKVKPWVRFGISPFGIWRPGEPASVTGFDAYERIYADARLWLSRGWVDYLVPQLYWGVEQDGQRFPDLLRWWQAQNDSARHVWPGLADYKLAEGRRPWPANEILRQIDTTRAVPGVDGAVHFQMRTLLQDRDQVATSLARGPYARRALTPAAPWKRADAPATPAIAIAESRVGPVITMGPKPEVAVRWWVVQTRSEGTWRTYVLDGSLTEIPISRIEPDGNAPLDVVALTAVGRTGVSGVPVAIRVR
jgi:uncharacterized lipoprotein YddW (UPF0748 family)